MKIYNEVDTFDSRTGKPLGKKVEESGCICDYCGKLIEDDGTQEVEFKVKQVGGSEETWYYGEYEGLKKEIFIDNFKLFAGNDTYHYCQNEDGKSCSLPMIKKGLKNKEVRNLEEIMEDARRKMVVKVLNNGEYTVKQLNAETD